MHYDPRTCILAYHRSR